ncbi:hypothetical protein LLQ46_23175 [Rouxiella badensis]|uniref:hypothetical protein n=1 Tax=Rouxiella badensis TaxID=1646377 RepID=UPI001D13BC2D|nr:hypothetical protein [Rouxiella badensis]MCC3749757.1 hypothetical protein [Rouxiella badensis]
MAVGDVIYSSNDSIDGSDGAMRIIVTVGGKKIPVPAVFIQFMTGGANQTARNYMGIPGQVHEQVGEVTLGEIAAPDISDLTLNDSTITDAKVVALFAQHAEAIQRTHNTQAALVEQWNVFIRYCRNEQLLKPVS